MAELRIWRYYLPNENGQGWAEIVLSSGGFFAAVSDYGNYAFAWRHHGEPDFRIFVANIAADPSYVAGKLGPCSGRPYPVDYEVTVKAIREEILQKRRNARLTKEQARHEWDLSDTLESESCDFGLADWHRETSISDASELVHRRPPANLRAFCERTMPRLAEVLRAELQAEKAAAGEAGAEQ
jgi:hypothetical protein